MKKGIMVITLLLIIASTVYCEIVDWGIHSGLVLSGSIGKDNTYNLNYSVFQNFSMIDTTNQSNNLITDEILVGDYLLESERINLKPTFSAGAFLSYKISEGRNVFMIQPEINWMRYSLEFNFNESAQINYYDGAISYELADSTIYVNNFDGLNIMSTSNNISNNIKTTIDFIEVPLLLKMQREFGDNNAGFIYVGPSFGFKILDNTKVLNDLKDIFDSYSDLDTLTTYTSEKILDSIDELNSMQFDAVFGFGWKFNEFFGIGLGEDFVTFDLRHIINVNNLTVNDKMRFYSFNFLLGYHF